MFIERMLTRAMIATAALAITSAASAQFASKFMFSGVTRPTVVTHAPGDETRLFILEKLGYIEIYNLETGTLNSTPFLNIDSVVYGGSSNNDEQGALGLAFHPDYQNNGYFYVYYTATSGSGDSFIRRYQRNGDNPDQATTSGALTIMSFDQPYWNHNGGWLAFGPKDGYLYISTGDGGSGGDPGNRAQDITNQKLGKILRIDVDGGTPYAIPPTNPFVGVTGDDEIWSYGHRNPWRCCFDSLTGDMWIGDVGQNAREEINFEIWGTIGGFNYGWKCMEANSCYSTSNGCVCNSSSYVDPIYEYFHNSAGGYSVTGGEVYRGCQMPEEHGTYFFADYVSGNIWKTIRNANGTLSTSNIRSDVSPSIDGYSISGISCFGTDARGEVYIAAHTTGRIFKIIPEDGEIDCDFEPPVNDECKGALPLADGSNSFTTIDASDSGWEVPLTCSKTNGPGLGTDVWFTYTATCTGFATISTCGNSDFDDRFVVYAEASGCANSDSSVYACSDDTCGTSSSVEFLAIEGQQFQIRIGSVDGSEGSGEIVVSCAPIGGGCPEDLNGDNSVDGADLGLLLSAWGTADGDLNDDGLTNGADLGLMLAAFGSDC